MSNDTILSPGVIFLPHFLDTFCFSTPIPQCAFKTCKTESFKTATLPTSSFVIDGNHFKTWFQSSGDMPVARKPDFKFSKDNRAINNERRQGKWLLGMQPPVLDSFLHQIRMFLQIIFAGRKTATSSGCVKCVEFGTRVINMILF